MGTEDKGSFMIEVIDGIAKSVIGISRRLVMTYEDDKLEDGVSKIVLRVGFC